MFSFASKKRSLIILEPQMDCPSPVDIADVAIKNLAGNLDADNASKYFKFLSLHHSMIVVVEHSLIASLKRQL
jgi:hypothetical protein